jgi:hypothetical protein
LENLKGIPEEIFGSVDCSKNYLSSLYGISKSIHGWLDISEQKSGVSFTYEEIKEVCDVKRNIYA